MKNTDTTGQQGYDAGKKVSGIKRHIAVDTHGLPYAVAVTTAQVSVQIGKRGELHTFKVMPKRWIVERSLAWQLLWDHAVMESFFSSLKKERIRKRIYKTREMARADVFDYIEVFYTA